MTGGTCSVDDGKRGCAAGRMGNVITVVWTVEIFSVPTPTKAIRSFDFLNKFGGSLQREYNIRPNTPGARLFRKVVGIPLRIHARRIHAASKVRLLIAPVALLHVLP